jgi:hypothetical protein
MIWQSIHSNPISIAAVAAITLSGLVTPLLAWSHELTGTASFCVAVSSLAAPLGFSWLGVFVFQGDGSGGRVRFLAERGVSPATVYFGRHALPLAIAATCLFFYFLVASRRVALEGQDPMRSAMPSLLTVTLLALLIYSVSQWTSQLFRTLVLAVIVSPVIAILGAAWFVFSAFECEVPLWMLFAVSCLPLVATYGMMQRYIDGRDRPLSFIVAGMLVAIVLLVPIGYAALRVTRTSAMTSSERARLMDEGEAIWQAAARPIELRLAPRNKDVYGDDFSTRRQEIPVDRVLRYIDSFPHKPVQYIPALAAIREKPNSPAKIETYELEALISRLASGRLRLEASDDWQAFAPWLVAAAEISSALRRSVRWTDQHHADLLEGWVAETLTSDPAVRFSSDPAYRRAVEHLSSRTERDQARRAAVLATWASPTDQVVDRGLGWQPSYLAPWMAQRRVDAVVATALSALEGDSDRWLRQMHQLQSFQVTPFEYGPYSPRYRDLPMTVLAASGRHFPAQLWHMPWEETAEQLIGANQR